jgi:hypothetical protein
MQQLCNFLGIDSRPDPCIRPLWFLLDTSIGDRRRVLSRLAILALKDLGEERHDRQGGLETGVLVLSRDSHRTSDFQIFCSSPGDRRVPAAVMSRYKNRLGLC